MSDAEAAVRFIEAGIAADAEINARSLEAFSRIEDGLAKGARARDDLALAKAFEAARDAFKRGARSIRQRSRADLAGELARIQAENEALKRVVRFYADEKNWGGLEGDNGRDAIVQLNAGNVKIYAPARHRLGPACDVGQHARATLAELEADPDQSTATSLWLGG